MATKPIKYARRSKQSILESLKKVLNGRAILFTSDCGRWFLTETFFDSDWKSYVYHGCSGDISPFWIIPWDTKKVSWRCNTCKHNIPDSVASLWTLQNFDRLNEGRYDNG